MATKCYGKVFQASVYSVRVTQACREWFLAWRAHASSNEKDEVELIEMIARILSGIFLLLCIGMLADCSSIQEPSELQAYAELSPADQQQLEPGPVQAYKIAVGDVLNIQVLKRSDLTPAFNLPNMRVSELGMIYLPLAGDIKVVGLSEQELRKEVKFALSSDLREPVISVKIVEAQNKRIYLLGEVKSPGVYTLVNNISLLELIAMAGGHSRDADMSRIALFRSQLPAPEHGQSKPGVALDIQTLLENAQFQQNIILQPGDIIYVPNNSIAHSNRYFDHLQRVIQPFSSLISAVGNIVFINRERGSSQ